MKKVNIIIGRFQPITKGHIKCIEVAYQQLHIPTIIVMIEPKTQDARHPFVVYELIDMYKRMFKNDPKIIDIITTKNADIVKIGSLLYEKGYQVAGWVCGTDRYASYKKMTDKYHDQAHLSDDFQLIEIKRTDEDVSATSLRQALLNDDYETFIRLFPQTERTKILFNKLKAMISWLKK